MTAPANNAFRRSLEATLLLACARASSGAADAAQLRQLAQPPGLDWERLLAQAKRHAVRPLLYRSLRQGGADAVPGAVLGRLEGESQCNAQRSLHLTGELLRLLALLEERKIRALPYKGPVLSSQAYADLGLREFLDLDILVPVKEFPAAKKALASAGYQPALALTSRQERALVRSNCEYVMHHPERQSTVELHWRIAPAHFAVEFDFEGLWARRRSVPLGGGEVSTLADEDLLLVLSVHAAKHLWECLCWICDIAELLRARPGMDWPRLLREAEQLGALRFLLISLELSRELLGTELPAAVREKIAGDPEVRSLALALIRRMWTEGGVGITLGVHWLLVRARERWRDRARYILRLVFTPGVSEWSLLELPTALAPLYPVIRLGRVAGKLVRSLWPHSAPPPAAAARLDHSPDPPRS